MIGRDAVIAEGESRQDRCQGHSARQVNDVPGGGGRRAPTTPCYVPQMDREHREVADTVSIWFATLIQAG